MIWDHSLTIYEIANKMDLSADTYNNELVLKKIEGLDESLKYILGILFWHYIFVAILNLP